MAKNNTNEQSTKSYPKMNDLRLQQIHYELDDLKADALAITYMPNIRYLTGFSGSTATMFVTHDDITFVTDDRYEEQIKTELYPLPNLKTYISRNVWGLIQDKIILKKVASLAFEADRISYADAVSIRNIIRPLKFKPGVNLVERFTIPKAPEELENIQKACDIAIKVYEKILEEIKPGITERDIAIEIAYQTRKLGSEGDPFPIIVVSGERGGLVHGAPSNRKFKKGDLVLMDFGSIVNGFCSDITRTVAIGKITKEQKTVYDLINRAKETAIENVRPGMNGKILDNISRKIIKDAGYGDYFQHSLGHGIGLVAHEMPTITFRMEDQIVPENCVLALEPGVYIPNKFGIRIEDCILVTRNGSKYLTKAPQEIVTL